MKTVKAFWGSPGVLAMILLFGVPILIITPRCEADSKDSDTRDSATLHVLAGASSALLISAIRDPDPVIFYEGKAIYRAFREEVPEEEETMPIGKSQLVREGKDLTMISYGAMMRPALEAAAELHEKDGIEAEVIDLLTISPLDEELFIQSVQKTGHAMVIHEAPRSFGPGAEVVSRLVEKAFFYLEAPIARVTGFDVIIPLFSREKAYLPSALRVANAARKLLSP